MPLVNSVQLGSFIFHILDRNNPNPDEKLSEQVLDLRAHPTVAEFFATHIKNSMNDPLARAASFVDADGPVGSISTEILGDDGRLIDGSVELARRLCALLVADRRISQGNLAVCLFGINDAPEIYLGLLKFDPGQVFTPHLRSNAGGRYVEFRLQGDTLPTTRERLQKCAFILPPAPDRSYHMKLVDRQSGDEDRPIALFFSDSFLGATLTFTPADQTLQFFKAALAADREIRALLTDDEQRMRWDLARYNALNAEVVELDQWIAALDVPDNIRERIDEIMSQQVIDRTFEVDTTDAEKFTQKRLFLANGGLRVEVDTEDFRQLITEIPPGQGDGADPNRWTITIKAENWREVLR